MTSFTDFGRDVILDADGERIPFQEFYFLKLSNGYSFAVRASGTEPKIKFYAFGRSELDDLENLDKVKAAASEVMQSLLTSIEADARKRADG